MSGTRQPRMEIGVERKGDHNPQHTPAPTNVTPTVYNAQPYRWSPPAGYEGHVYTKHVGENSQYLRDALLGFNDGLLSNLLLVIGMYATGSNSLSILLTGVAGSIAGMFAMAMGEYVATKNQRLTLEGDLKLEKTHLKFHRDVEIHQTRGYLRQLGIDGPLLETVLHKIGDSDKAMLTLMSKFEFGQSSEEMERHPVTAAATSGVLFLAGSLPPALPFIWSNRIGALVLACCLSAAVNFVVGSVKVVTTKGNWLIGGIEHVVIAIAGGGIAYGVGAAYLAVRVAIGGTSNQTIPF